MNFKELVNDLQKHNLLSAIEESGANLAAARTGLLALVVAANHFKPVPKVEEFTTALNAAFNLMPDIVTHLTDNFIMDLTPDKATEYLIRVNAEATNCISEMEDLVKNKLKEIENENPANAVFKKVKA